MCCLPGTPTVRPRPAVALLALLVAALAATPATAEDIVVSFDYSSYTVAEGDVVGVAVLLSATPESVDGAMDEMNPITHQIEIPLTHTSRGGARPQGIDYCCVPTVVKFWPDERSEGFGFWATLDDEADPGESVEIRIVRRTCRQGTSPARSTRRSSPSRTCRHRG